MKSCVQALPKREGEREDGKERKKERKIRPQDEVNIMNFFM
jgi:hypothetical protein